MPTILISFSPKVALNMLFFLREKHPEGKFDIEKENDPSGSPAYAITFGNVENEEEYENTLSRILERT